MGHLKNTRYINIPVYNVSMEDDILNLDTSIGITLVFPNVQDSGCMYADKRWYVNDATGGSAANPVTITAVSGIQINDAASQQLSTANFGACVFATNQQKYVITGSGGSGGTTIVTSPFTPSNTAIIVGDDFQDVAEKAQGQINDIVTNVTELQNNEYKITYFAEISAASGTITKPTGSTILLDQFAGGVDAYVSTITNGQPTGDFPETAGGVLVDVTSFDTSGNFVLSGTPSAYPCALIYILKISAADYQNLTTANILEAESSFGKAPLNPVVDITSLCTITGWASFTTCVVTRIDLGNAYLVNVYISGVSNSGTASVQLDFTSSINCGNYSYAVSNGSGVYGRVLIAAGSDTIDWRANAAGASFVATGTKLISGQLWLPKP